jgi:Fic-DOC domain mobile mystery protein B
MITENEPKGTTPLDPDETNGLLLTHITSREELNYWEQQNISEAEEWAFGRRQRDLLSQGFICRLHKKMLGDVWKWAGSFRTSQKNIGIDPWQIATELGQLLGDVNAWIKYDTYPPDEIAARFHHRLAQIHPFPNGNGRHARLMTDLLLEQILNQPRFTWGRENLADTGETRNKYIAALQAADQSDFTLLFQFVRT